MAGTLDSEFRYYLQHQEDLIGNYDGRYVVIKDDTVLGAYEDELEAVTETQKSHELGTFLIQRVSRGTSAYTHTFHSRVVFQ